MEVISKDQTLSIVIENRTKEIRKQLEERDQVKLKHRPSPIKKWLFNEDSNDEEEEKATTKEDSTVPDNEDNLECLEKALLRAMLPVLPGVKITHQLTV